MGKWENGKMGEKEKNKELYLYFMFRQNGKPKQYTIANPWKRQLLLHDRLTISKKMQNFQMVIRCFIVPVYYLFLINCETLLSGKNRIMI